MRNYTLQQYKEMSDKFNKLNFAEKIKTIRDNSDILQLASDGNWWAVWAKDKDIQEQLYERDNNFQIENEWDSSEMHDLVGLLGINIEGM